MSTIIDQFEWIFLIIGIILVWLVLKFIRKMYLRIMAIIFTAIGVFRLWLLINGM